MPIEAVKAELTELVTDSVAYTVFRKCGIDTAPIEEKNWSDNRPAKFIITALKRTPLFGIILS